MSKIRSKQIEGVILYNEKESALHNLAFKNVTSMHFLDSKLVYLCDSNWRSIPKITEEDYKEIEQLYDNYQINKITLDLMKSDPISSVIDIKKRAAEFYQLMKKEIQ